MQNAGYDECTSIELNDYYGKFQINPSLYITYCTTHLDSVTFLPVGGCET